jgi:hypothetical protein
VQAHTDVTCAGTCAQVGAGTMNPATFLRVLGPEPWRVCYVEPSVRPDDSRYGDNPNRLQQHTQFQACTLNALVPSTAKVVIINLSCSVEDCPLATSGSASLFVCGIPQCLLGEEGVIPGEMPHDWQIL